MYLCKYDLTTLRKVKISNRYITEFPILGLPKFFFSLNANLKKKKPSCEIIFATRLAGRHVV